MAKRDRIAQIVDQALVQNDIDHAFQPVWDLKTARLIGFEALARFPGGMAPDRIFRHALIRGRGRALDVLSVRTAVYQARSLPGVLFVNSHPDHLLPTPGTAAGSVLSAITRYRRRDALVLEITEAPDHDRQLAMAGLERVRHLGIRVALDDAGTRASNVGRLRWVHPRYIKIDRSLIVRARTGREKSLRQWVKAAQQIGATVIAEGVEDPEWGEWLVALGIDWVQGYGFGRPEPAARWAATLLDATPPIHLTAALASYSPPAFDQWTTPAPPMSNREVGELLFDSLPFPVFFLDDQGALAGLNREAGRFWEVALSPLTRQPWQQALGIRSITPPLPPAAELAAPYSANTHRVVKHDGRDLLITLLIYRVEKQSRAHLAVMVADNPLPNSRGHNLPQPPGTL
ncbi:MAG: EAL domain-containing protein [Thermaerobacter sp.]|nr:EAL domain-containing protein [Thermaerobacter sp.]